MALANIEFYSNCLCRCVTFKAIIPTDANALDENGQTKPEYQRTMKTLVLLHGYSAMCSDWIWNSQVMDIANRYNLCVLLPSGENSFYLDGKETGRQYATFVGEELLAFARKTFRLSDKKEDTYIGGFSMGGFGAIHLGLQFADTFQKVFALSSALIMHEVMDMKPGSHNGVANYDYFKLMFGEPELLAQSENNPEAQIRMLQEKNHEVPPIYMACGTQDFLLKENRSFAQYLDENKVEHIYEESEGNHNYEFWNRYLEPAVKWLLEK